MFESYQNLNPQYTPNNYQTCACTNKNIEKAVPNKPYEVYDQSGNLIGYFWYYGNSFVLTFDVVGEATFYENDSFVDVFDVLKDCNTTLTVYDNWWNIVYQNTKESKELIKTDSGCSISFEITEEISKTLLKGKYRMELVVSNKLGYNETIFANDTCIFEVR